MRNPNTIPGSVPDEEKGKLDSNAIAELIQIRQEVTEKCYNLIADAIKNSKNPTTDPGQKISPEAAEELFVLQACWEDLFEIEAKDGRTFIKIRKKAPHHPVLLRVIEILNENPLTSNAEAFNILSDVRSKLNRLMTDHRPLLTQIIEYIEKKLHDSFPPTGNK